MPMIEVEIKFRVPDRALIDRLVAHAGLEFGPAQLQRDLYFNHPQRCFRETDEALRIRTAGGENALTIKVPVFDRFRRTRPGTEIPFASGAETAEQLRSVLLALGFREIEQVEKLRRIAPFEWQGRPVEVTLDEVRGLGEYLEIEMLADESTWQTARDQIVAIATQWEILDLREPRSYLRMILEKASVLPTT